jgi:hypothetical protein
MPLYLKGKAQWHLHGLGSDGWALWIEIGDEDITTLLFLSCIMEWGYPCPFGPPCGSLKSDDGRTMSQPC